jgi:hypothetical protein
MGGADGDDELLVDSDRYRDGAGWEAIPAWPSTELHAEGVGIWTGSEFVLWSGEATDSDDPTSTGERWAP